MTDRKFLVVVDDSPEFRAAMRYACLRASSTGGAVALLRVLQPSAFDHWSGVREEIEREQRAEAQALLSRLGAEVAEITGRPPVFLIKQGDTKAAIREAVLEDAGIKVLILAAAVGGRGPGPLVSSLAKEGVGFGGRKLPVTVVPGDLSEAELADLA